MSRYCHTFRRVPLYISTSFIIVAQALLILRCSSFRVAHPPRPHDLHPPTATSSCGAIPRSPSLGVECRVRFDKSIDLRPRIRTQSISFCRRWGAGIVCSAQHSRREEYAQGYAQPEEQASEESRGTRRKPRGNKLQRNADGLPTEKVYAPRQRM